MNSTDGTTSSSKKGGTPSKMTCALLSRQYKVHGDDAFFFLVLYTNMTKKQNFRLNLQVVWMFGSEMMMNMRRHFFIGNVPSSDLRTLCCTSSRIDRHTHTHSHTHTNTTVKEEFSSQLDFPFDFPNSPPKMRFTSAIWHPNVYPDGRVCISILHPPGTDVFNAEETAEERWRPILSVEAVLLSVMSMLADPNPSSPANIDAAVMFRKDPAAYKKRCKECVRRTLD